MPRSNKPERRSSLPEMATVEFYKRRRNGRYKTIRSIMHSSIFESIMITALFLALFLPDIWPTATIRYTFFELNRKEAGSASRVHGTLPGRLLPFDLSFRTRGIFSISTPCLCLENSLVPENRFRMMLDNSRVLMDIPDSYRALDAILVTVFGLFVIEMSLMFAVARRYLFSFFFWMDLLGALSLVFDISWALGDSESFLEGANVVLLRAARAAKLGARAGRIARISKLLRWMPGIGRVEDKTAGTAAVLGTRLMNALSTRVALLVLGLVVVLPFFEIIKYPEQDNSMQAWAQTFATITDVEGANVLASQVFTDSLSEFTQFYTNQDYAPFWMEISVGGSTIYSETLAPLPKRVSNELWARSSASNSVDVTLKFDFTTVNRISSAMSITLVVTVVLVMLLGATLLSNSVSRIVLTPLESLFFQVRSMSQTIFKTVHHISHAATLHDSEEILVEDDDIDDTEAFMSEATVLENVVGRLTALSAVFVSKQPVDAERMKELKNDDLAVIDMITRKTVRHSVSNEHYMEEIEGVQATCIDDAKRLASEPDGETAEEMGKDGQLDLLVLNSWNFNALANTAEYNVSALMYILLGSQLSPYYKQYLRRGTLEEFLKKAEAEYKACPYHNWRHAVDVTHTVFMYLSLSKSMSFLPGIDMLSVLIAAVVHDIGHPGLNNPFLIETGHDLAIRQARMSVRLSMAACRYNDKSPLENMHCAKFFEICLNEASNVLSELSTSQYRDVRRNIIECILHTDNSHHFKMVKDLQVFYQLNKEVIDEGFQKDEWSSDCIALYSDDDTRLTLIQLYLHAADISNPTKPFPICKAWADLILNEFFSQGDLEKSQGIPVQMLNDRDKVSRPHSQIGFIEFLVAPLVQFQIQLFPSLYECGQNLVDNLCHWSTEWLETTDPPVDEREKLLARLQKVSSLFDFHKEIKFNQPVWPPRDPTRE
ncbi:Calcium/calmodulin-dependent 3',5'-cyclic nucleotide phosphodiesterase 1B [Perkinsus chesapeaki]|uniref:Phosphodiesterase n=1 Tax=Perkinsus chesapeaki TaxID=330153 RepID=A0A7J6LI50_PERCH|nr:Calcium/calmodulin-dependent 3',5'-cyclic nucleotide phosphodiesterase 1B [Perkinsus chesapeaki]